MLKNKLSMSSRKKVVVAISAAALAVSTFAATGIGAHAAVPGKKGGTLIYVTLAEQINHLDPQQVYTGQDIAFLNSYIFRTLVQYKRAAGKSGFDLVPDLATDIGKATNGGKTWKFTLKSGVKYEDGSAVTCQDLKYGVSRSFSDDIADGPSYAKDYLDIPKDSKNLTIYKGPYVKTGQNYYDKAVTCSGNTITFNLNKPVGDFNYLATYPTMSPVKASIDQVAATGGVNYDKKPLATGPYKIAKNVKGDQLQLVRNPQWSADADPLRPAFPDEVIVRFSIAGETRDQIFINDSTPNAVNYDQAMLPTNINAFYNNPKTSSRGNNVFGPYVRYYAFNTAKGHLDCLDVRKAIFFAWPIKQLIDFAGGTRFAGTLGDSPINPLVGIDYAPTTGNVHDANFKITGNPTYAKQLLAAAKTSCPDTYAKVTDESKGFSIDLANTPTLQKASVVLKASLNAAGLHPTFNFINSGTYYSTVQDNDKQGDMTRAGWGSDWANASTVIPPLFVRGNSFALSQNWNEVVYPSFLKKVEAAQAQTNRKQQAEQWKELAQIVMDNYWISPPFFSKEQYQWGSKVGGIYFWEPQGSLIFSSLFVK